MKRHTILAAVSALGLVASAGAATVHRSVWSEGYESRAFHSTDFGSFNPEIFSYSEGRVAWMESVVNCTTIQAMGGAEEFEWMWDPGNYGSYEYQIGWVSMSVDFMLPTRRSVQIFSVSEGDAYALLEGPVVLITGDWAGWLEPGAYTARAMVNTEGWFSFAMDVPAPAGLLALVGGVLMCSRRRIPAS